MLTNAQLTLEQFWSLAMHFQTLSHLYCKTLGTIPWEIFQINSFLPVLYLILHNTFDQNLCENPHSIIIRSPGPVFLLLWGRRCIPELHGFGIFPTQSLCHNLVMWVKCLLVCKCLPPLWTSRSWDWRISISLEVTVQPNPTSSQNSLLSMKLHKKRKKKKELHRMRQKILNRMRWKVFVCCQRCQTIRPVVLGDSEDGTKSTFLFLCCTIVLKCTWIYFNEVC